MFAPPFRDPFNYVFDPMIPTGLDFVAMGMQRRFASEGKPGVVSREASSYSTWWNGGLRTAGYFHNMIGILTETIGSPTPTTIPLVLARQLPSGSGQFPIAPQVWRFRQSIDYSMTANRAILDYASRYREELLFDFWQMGRNSIARGSTDTWTTTPVLIDAARAAGTSTQAQAAALRDPARRDPRAYVIPANQAEIGTALDFLQALSTSGIEVQKATADFSIGGTRYPKGSFVVRTDHAFRQHVLDRFEPHCHPTDLPYPGGPSVEKAAAAGNPSAFKFPRAWLEGTWDFSFSGLKTAALYEVKQQKPGRPMSAEAAADTTPPDPALVPHLAASFQAAIVEVLVGKTVAAAQKFGVTEIFVAVGVSANRALKAEFDRRATCPVRVPPVVLCTDNAAMIAAAANFRYLAGQRDALDIDALPNWKLV